MTNKEITLNIWYICM